MSSYFFRSLLCIFLISCGYQWQKEPPLCLSVPYVEGDGDGSLTQEIIRSLTISGKAIVNQHNAPYRLETKIIRSDNSVIGYRRDRQEINGKSQKNLIASESRNRIAIEALIRNLSTNQIHSGPFQIESYVDYDYIDQDSIYDLTFVNPEGQVTAILPFSLGQLQAIDMAREASMRPLEVLLAKKLIDLLFQ